MGKCVQYGSWNWFHEDGSMDSTHRVSHPAFDQLDYNFPLQLRPNKKNGFDKCSTFVQQLVPIRYVKRCCIWDSQRFSGEVEFQIPLLNEGRVDMYKIDLHCTVGLQGKWLGLSPQGTKKAEIEFINVTDVFASLRSQKIQFEFFIYLRIRRRYYRNLNFMLLQWAYLLISFISTTCLPIPAPLCIYNKEIHCILRDSA